MASLSLALLLEFYVKIEIKGMVWLKTKSVNSVSNMPMTIFAPWRTRVLIFLVD